MDSVGQLVCIKSKNNKLLPVSLVLSFEDKPCYRIDIYENAEYSNVVGSLSATFNVTKRECWLSSIKILDKNWHLKGIGSAMLYLLEDFCCYNGIVKIDGKYYPNGEGANNVEHFYINRGFEIYKDGYNTLIYKDVKNTNTRANVTLYPYTPSSFDDLCNAKEIE